MKLSVPGHTTVERVGNEVLVCDLESSRVHRLSGGARDLVLRVLEAGILEVASDDETAGALVEAGVLAANGMSRRTAMGLAAAAAAAGIVTVVLPSAAAAQSPGSVDPPQGLQAFPDDTQVYLTWLPEAGAESYQVLYRVSPSGEYTVFRDVVFAESELVTGLTNGTSYEFAVRTRINGVLSGQAATVVATPLVIATGGTVTSYTFGGVIYKVHSFTTVGSGSSFVLNTITDVDYLVVGGGGSGGTAGSNSGCGGGGAGGFREGAFTSLAAGTYGVTVGAGGVAPNTSGDSSVQGVSGGASVVNSISAAGGGGGGRFGQTGNSGGSGGGGGGRSSTAGGAGNSPTTTPAQGNGGGRAREGSVAGQAAGGGGGGAGAQGGDGGNLSDTATLNYAGDGGAGAASSITGASVTYGGGGGGGAVSDTSQRPARRGDGGAGGGGAGGMAGQQVSGLSNTAESGSANTGGGGGGAGNSARGGNGGSGVVILRYALDPAPA